VKEDPVIKSHIDPALFQTLFDARKSHLFRDFQHLYAFQRGEIYRKLLWEPKGSILPCCRKEKLKTYKGTPSIMAIEPVTEEVHEQIE